MPTCIQRLNTGDEVVITENDKPVAKLVRLDPNKQWPCKAGSAKGKIHWMAPTSTNRSKSSRSTWSDDLLWSIRTPCSGSSGTTRILTPTAKALIEDPANRKFVSVATCWEIAIKVGLKKLNLGEPATTFVPRELAANKIRPAGHRAGPCHVRGDLAAHHRDPFDRLLAAQAMLEKMRLVSADAVFDRYGVIRLWQ